jgi:Uma2 family endonuclease
MAAREARVRKDLPQEDRFVVLHEATWADYQRLLEMRGDRSVPRITYVEGALEILTPCRNHESIKSTLGCLVDLYCLENDIEYGAFGSWTLENKEEDRGAEPDDCYVFGRAREATRPDLAIEVVWTSGRIDKLNVYRKLGVAEIWYWRNDELKAYVLRGDRYRPVARSKALPGIDLAELARHVHAPTTSQAIRDYRATLGKSAKKRRC